MPSYVLYMTSYPHFMTTTLNIYEIKCTIFTTSPALYMISHLLCMMSHALCVLHHTMTLSKTSNTMFMTYSLDMASREVLWPHIHCVPSQPLCLTLLSGYFWHDTQCSNLMKEGNVCHHSLYMHDPICTTYDITSTVYDIIQLYLWRKVHYI